MLAEATMHASITIVLAFSLAPCVLQAQEGSGAPSTPDTLPPFGDMSPARSDSTRLVAAANDALQGKFGITAPMRVIAFRRSPDGVLISMKPDSTRGITWDHLGGLVRVLTDGRRVILRRF
jgi:hypothetical protein